MIGDSIISFSSLRVYSMFIDFFGLFLKLPQNYFEIKKIVDYKNYNPNNKHCLVIHITYCPFFFVLLLLKNPV